MFRTLYESFENPSVTELQNNIARYQSLEPNYAIINNQNDYSFPNAGTQAQQLQSSNTALQGALNSLGSVFVPGTTRGSTEPTDLQDVGKVLTGIPDSIGERVKKCRKFEGLTGLSNLQRSQTDRTAGERCAWRYKSGTGVIPEVAQAAYGNRDGPLDPARPTFDRVGNGVQYFWDLESAEKQMVKDICKSATQCIDMTAVPLTAAGDFSNVCGYCETSKKIIPIKTENGIAIARYNDVDTQCAPANIVTMKNAKQRCPAPPPGSPQAPSWKCLNADKLDRDCVVLSALFAGCSPQGTLINALQRGKNNNDYADLLRNQKSFKAFQELSQIPLSDDVIGSGNSTLFAAFMNNFNLNRNMYNPDNVKRWIASVDLCQYGGLYEQWNFCNDLKDGDKDFELKCMQQYFLQNGGTSQGADFPSAENEARLRGTLTWSQYKATVNKLKENTLKTDITIQRDALNKLMGLAITKSPTKLPRGEGSQGVEVFYFDRRRKVFLGRRPYLSAAGRNLPNFNVGSGVVENTGLIDGVEILYIYDMRPDNDSQVAFGTVTDDGWAIAKNQNVYNIKDWSNGAAWWYDQGPTWHNTSAMQVTAENRGEPNIFMGAWYENGGGAVFHPFYKLGQTIFNRGGQSGWIEIGRGNTPSFPIDQFWKNNCYFVQEEDAPTIQFEALQPKFYYTQGLHFLDKRLWGQESFRDTTWNQTAQTKRHEFSRASAPLPQNTFAMTLRNTAQYSTVGSIAFSAIRTWSILFRIDTFVKGRNNTNCEIFHLTNSMGGRRNFAVRVYDIGSPDFYEVSLIHTGQRSVQETSRIRISAKKWYFCIVRLHPENLSSRAINRMSMFVQTYENMAAGKVLDGTRLLEISATTEGVLFNDVARDRSDAGRMILATNHNNGEQKSFVYAWVHGFDDVIETSDTESWKKEATKGWLGRWYE